MFTSTIALAQTQAEMNQEAINDFKTADAELNKVYKLVLSKLDEKQKKNLIIAQKNWINFRDAHCNFQADLYEGGTIQPLIRYSCLASKTNDRIDDLNEILADLNL